MSEDMQLLDICLQALLLCCLPIYITYMQLLVIYIYTFPIYDHYTTDILLQELLIIKWNTCCF